jgi:predicted Zn-dependent protease with MMP-like domain
MQRPQPHRPRIRLRDRVDPTTAELTALMFSGCIFAVAVTARMPQLLALAAIFLGVGLYFGYENAPAQTAPREAAATRRIDFALQRVGRLTDEEFDALVDEVERQARLPACDVHVPECFASLGDEEFEQLVRDALDELPDFVRHELEVANVAVTVSDGGHGFGAYGLYVGGSLAYDGWASQILIFRDTLTRDFGADRDELRHQVITTVRHEVAHHLGAGERHVRDLGL